jgi:putative NIF3 family GTP cyclohydrolase 1 type 2
MKINEIVQSLDELAPFYLQEDYDNAGLIIGQPDWETDGCLICVDVNEAVIEEAVRLNFRLLITIILLF